MLLLEAEAPTCRGYLHEVNTPFRFSVDEDIADAPGDAGGRIFDFSEATPHDSIGDPSRVKTKKKAGIAKLIRSGTYAVPRPTE